MAWRNRACLGRISLILRLVILRCLSAQAESDATNAHSRPNSRSPAMRHKRRLVRTVSPVRHQQVGSAPTQAVQDGWQASMVVDRARGLGSGSRAVWYVASHDVGRVGRMSR
ncbi:hypothetical protein K456DRAFT_1336455 [Colletotrichum gloeosporioides 23]|nr:hypothetical protein K456DRAFT_1336455 [Colletotrichum gloeosporioides 23]